MREWLSIESHALVSVQLGGEHFSFQAAVVQRRSLLLAFEEKFRYHSICRLGGQQQPALPWK